MSQITDWNEFPAIEYVPGVFRQAFCGEKAMMTRITYKPGVVIPNHSHEAEQLMMVEKGQLWAKVEGEEKVVGPGTLLIVRSNAVHAFKNLSDEDTVFYEVFAPIRLEYLIGYKGPDPALKMIQEGREKKEG